MIRLFLVLAIISLHVLAKKAPHIVDLTHDVSEKTIHWPETDPFKITKSSAEVTPEGFYTAERYFTMSEHLGTHMDAPNHFAKGHPGVDGVSLSQLIGPAIKVDVSKIVKNNPDHQIGIKDFEQWEKLHGTIPDDTIVLLSTGYGKYWPNLEKYSGTKKTGIASIPFMHFPGLDPKAAIWLVEKRKIKAIGIDVFGIDYGQTKKFEAHQELTKRDIPIFENVASMENIPAKNFIIYALPMKLKDGTAAPIRIIAQVE